MLLGWPESKIEARRQTDRQTVAGIRQLKKEITNRKKPQIVESGMLTAITENKSLPQSVKTGLTDRPPITPSSEL